MKLKAFVIGATALLTIAAAIAAPGVTGKWKGHVHLDPSVFPKAQSPQQQAQVNQVVETMKKTQFSLDVAASNTFTLVIPVSMDKKSHSASGTWKLAGNTLTLTATKQDGKPVTGKGQAQSFTISKDGKTLTLNAGQGMKAGMLVFTR